MVNIRTLGVPLVFPLIGVLWGGLDYASPKTCFLRRKYGLITFYGPVVLSTSLNIYLFVRIAWSTFTKKSIDTGSMSLSTLERHKKQFKFAITVMTLLGIGWVFGFFLIFLETNAIWIRWLFIVSNSTQGIFMFVLYVALNDGLRKVWKRLLGLSAKPKLSHSSAPIIKGTVSTEEPGTYTFDTKPGHHSTHLDPTHHRGIGPSPNVQRRAPSPNVQRRPRSPNVQIRPN
ncbi:hypothetical protein ACHWQZ_G001164 [Mnemiopsis leidyi]